MYDMHLYTVHASARTNLLLLLKHHCFPSLAALSLTATFKSQQPFGADRPAALSMLQTAAKHSCGSKAPTNLTDPQL